MPSNRRRGSRITVLAGIDGVGKTSALSKLAALYQKETSFKYRSDLPPFDVPAFETAHGRLPSLQETEGHHLLIVGEPSHSPPTGTAIRDGLLKRDYPADIVVQAEHFAADRERLYAELVIPFLARDPRSFVIQSRGLICSLTYQAPRWPGNNSLQDGVNAVLELRGNQLELEHAPTLMLILEADPDEAQKRMGRRRLDVLERDKQLQQEVHSLYQRPEIQAPFRERGTTVRTVDASKDIARTERNIDRIFEDTNQAGHF